MSHKPNWKSRKSNREKMPRLSVCMIVRDEEAVLERCLRSVKAVADEIIMVDTGSKDRSIEIARGYGAKVYEHPWRDNFSLHRNQSLKYAASDWILVIDADEELLFRDGLTPRDFKNFLKDFPKDCDAISTQLLDYRHGKLVSRHNTTRFHRRGAGHYEGIVHNQWVCDGLAGFSPQMAIKHYGYEVDSTTRQAKLDRTERLLLKQLDMLGENLHTHFYLAQSYGMKEDHEKCVEHGEKYWARRAEDESVGKGFYGSIHYVVARHYMKLGDKTNALEWIYQGLREHPGDPDLCMALSDYGVWIEDNEAVTQGALGFVAAYTGKSSAALGAHHTFTINPDGYALALYRLANIRLRQASAHFRALTESLPDASEELRGKIIEDTKKNVEESGVGEAVGEFGKR
ncbi:MAG: glycosyltransferase family 2 protein [Candidatus Adiutricales bacterium]